MLSKKIKWMVLLFLCLTGCIYCDMDVTAQEAEREKEFVRDQVKLYFTMRRNYSDWKLILR